MGHSKHGTIHKFCRSNGILTFAEYLEDFAKEKPELYKKGYELIDHYISKIEDAKLLSKTKDRLKEVKNGKRDVYF
jgi:2-iminoacetate synthase